MGEDDNNENDRKQRSIGEHGALSAKSKKSIMEAAAI